MQVSVEKTGPTERKLNVTVPAIQVDEAFSRAYREVGRQARVPGFRPGKVPRGILEVHYGPQVRSEVENKLVSQTLYLAMQEQEISPVGMPRIETGDLKKGTDFSYTAQVEVQPEIELGQYKYLVAPLPEIQLAKEEVDAELEKMREQSMQLVPVLIRDVVEEGDIVVMDYQGTIGGVAFEGGSAVDAMIEIGGQEYLPGFSEGLLGAKVPSERDIPIDFPEDYSAKTLAGKQASFHVTIKEIKRRELPDLDDEFAKDIGEETLDALREKLEGAMRVKREQEALGERRVTLLKALVDATPFDLPPSLVKAQAERMVAGATERVQMMTGKKFQLSEQELSSLAQESLADAEFQVRCGLLLLEVAKKEGLQVDAARVDAEIDTIATEAGQEGARVRAHYANQDSRRSLEYRLLEDKTVELLLEHAVSTKEEAAAALEKEAQQLDAASHAPASDDAAQPEETEKKVASRKAAKKKKATSKKVAKKTTQAAKKKKATTKTRGKKKAKTKKKG